MKSITAVFLRGALLSTLAVASLGAAAFTPRQAPADNGGAPGNVVLALSVEFPTGLQVSYTSNDYSFVNGPYDGYFDNRKCYSYDATKEVFSPASALNLSTGACASASQWSGDLLNWLTMTNLDQFRSVMTGGTRDDFSSMSAASPGDTPNSTILIRSFSDRNAYNNVKNLTASTPAGKTTARSGGYGSKFLIGGNFKDMDDTQRKQSCAQNVANGFTTAGKCFNIRVEACKVTGTAGIEANCQSGYTGVAKPEGIIQSYALPLRFSALGYLKEDGNNRNGGVLRSVMKSVGPLAVTGSGTVANANKEWDPTTGVMYANPDPAYATASGVANSGLMNYLNKFGYASGYKGNDPVGELYYASLLYLRNKPQPATWTSGLTAANQDGFPVIAAPPDPSIASCQKNFILGIGDIYTHCDGNVPGGNAGTCPGPSPADPDGLNAQALWDTVTGLEGSAAWTGGSNQGTPYMAGFAHWAHTNDIRADLTGKQTVDTYWVDVLENTNGQSSVLSASRLHTQYWFATKYGGFRTDLVPGNDPNADPTSWQTNGDTIPNTWFAGSTPASLKAGLTKAFSNIALSSRLTGSSSSAAVTSTRQTSASQTIYAGYDSRNWTGSVRSCAQSALALDCLNNPTWEASRWLDPTYTAGASPKLTDANRKIFTSYVDPTTGVVTSMPLRWTSLNTAQQTLLNTDGKGVERVNYLRGDRSNEGTLFRRRPGTLLGDIVDSGVVYIAKAPLPKSGTNFPGHAAYRTSKANRPAVVYVGANDGMLHAFSGVDGKELFAYSPSSVASKLSLLSSAFYSHEYSVDGTPMTGDIETSSGQWTTLLVGGLNGGGKGYYALDIGSQADFATADEASLATLVKWEFTPKIDADLGYTYNEPSTDSITTANLQIAKVADSTAATGAWRVIVGNGYGSTDGKAILYMLNANSGAVATKLQAGTALANGLSTPTPIDTDGDGLVDTVYAGDLLGVIHKFQFSKLSGSNYVLASSGDTSAAWHYIGALFDTGEPITAAPTVAPSCSGGGWNVMIGTGKLNESADYTDTSARSFVSVDDIGALTTPVASSDLASFTLVESTAETGQIVRNWTTPSMVGKKGWRMTFSNGERIVSNATLPADTGTVLFSTNKPSADLCGGTPTGYLMAVKQCTGASGNLVLGSITAGGIAFGSSGVLKVSDSITRLNNDRGVVCNQDGCKGEGVSLKPAQTGPGRYSWREVLTK